MAAAIQLCLESFLYVLHADRAELLSLNCGHSLGGLIVHMYRTAQVCRSLLALCALATLSLLNSPLRLTHICVGYR